MRDFFFYKNLSVNLENIIFFNIYIYSFPSFKTEIPTSAKIAGYVEELSTLDICWHH